MRSTRKEVAKSIADGLKAINEQQGRYKKELVSLLKDGYPNESEAVGRIEAMLKDPEGYAEVALKSYERLISTEDEDMALEEWAKSLFTIIIHLESSESALNEASNTMEIVLG